MSAACVIYGVGIIYFLFLPLVLLCVLANSFRLSVGIFPGKITLKSCLFLPVFIFLDLMVVMMRRTLITSDVFHAKEKTVPIKMAVKNKIKHVYYSRL